MIAVHLPKDAWDLVLQAVKRAAARNDQEMSEVCDNLQLQIEIGANKSSTEEFDLSNKGPYATEDDDLLAANAGITKHQLRLDRAKEDRPHAM